jgi:tRNA-specific 2-thiouridylase
LFPLGGDTKVRIREEALERGLITAKKPDSHDICFIPDGDTAGYLVRKLGEQPGDITDATTGEVLGRHSGTFTVTIGQRRGLNLTVPAEDGAPRYVVDIDRESGTVIVGAPELLDVDFIRAINPIWAGAPLGEVAIDVSAQVRAHAEPVPASAYVINGELMINLYEPIRGLAPGQAAVIYSGTKVLGSATVASTNRVGKQSALHGS